MKRTGRDAWACIPSVSVWVVRNKTTVRERALWRIVMEEIVSLKAQAAQARNRKLGDESKNVEQASYLKIKSLALRMDGREAVKHTKLNSRVQTLRAQSFTGRGSTDPTGAISTSTPSHQHLRCTKKHSQYEETDPRNEGSCSRQVSARKEAAFARCSSGVDLPPHLHQSV